MKKTRQTGKHLKKCLLHSLFSQKIALWSISTDTWTQSECILTLLVKRKVCGLLNIAIWFREKAKLTSWPFLAIWLGSNMSLFWIQIRFCACLILSASTEPTCRWMAFYISSMNNYRLVKQKQTQWSWDVRQNSYPKFKHSMEITGSVVLYENTCLDLTPWSRIHSILYNSLRSGHVSLLLLIEDHWLSQSRVLTRYYKPHSVVMFPPHRPCILAVLQKIACFWNLGP